MGVWRRIKFVFSLACFPPLFPGERKEGRAPEKKIRQKRRILAVKKTNWSFCDPKFLFEVQPSLFSVWLAVFLSLYSLSGWSLIRRRGGGCSELVSQVKPKYYFNFKIKLEINQTITREHIWGEEGFFRLFWNYLGMCMSMHELLNVIYFFALLGWFFFFEGKWRQYPLCSFSTLWQYRKTPELKGILKVSLHCSSRALVFSF